jgi:hypothetical protein
VEYCGRNCFPVSPLPLHAHKQKGTSERKLMGWKNIHYQGEIKRKKHCIRKPALIIVVLLTSLAQHNIDIEIYYKISTHFSVFLPFAKLVNSLQQMNPSKQAKVMQEFQKQSAQMDMTVS